MSSTLTVLAGETTLFVLIAALLVFRGLGALGVKRFASWPVSAAHALTVMLALAGIAHFMPDSVTVMPSHADLAAMVPPFVPLPGLMVLATGVLELAAAVGLVLSRTRWLAGMALIPLFIALIPANIYAAVNDIPLNGDPATPLAVRVPEQILYIAVAWWATRGASREWPAFPARATALPARGGPGQHDPADDGAYGFWCAHVLGAAGRPGADAAADELWTVGISMRSHRQGRTDHALEPEPSRRRGGRARDRAAGRDRGSRGG
ncbi:MAG: DoxX family protein, partial [Stackebrandtia sp.]